MTNAELFQEAQAHIPGGVSSPVRAFKAVGGTPLYLVRGEGAYVWDVEGRRYLDYVLSWGPLILGHAHPEVLKRVHETMEKGLTFGAPHPLEVELAKAVKRAYPVDLVRFVNSGTEATMSALRLARGYTGRRYIVKFRGNYHGHADGLLVEAGSGALTFGVPGSAGVPEEYAKLTLVAEYNEPEELKALFQKYGEEIAAVIFEPVVGNAGVLIPTQEFLKALHDLTRAYGAVLIADEVMTGFRLGFGGATALYGLKPDLITLGKILGGGLPAAAYAGRREIMEKVAPLGPVYQAGTLSGNPLAMASGLATLEILEKEPGIYEKLEGLGRRLEEGLNALLRETGTPGTVNRAGSMITLFFTEGPVRTLKDAKRTDTTRFKQVFHALLREGIYWPPSNFEAAFLSAAHTEEEVDRTLEAFRKALLA
ncbi:MAG: glutamate-1-semialdehyde 2,1-aminomutase [Thermaceae bacterium]